jgi:WhiB family redox-sensing transcriptional regulator
MGMMPITADWTRQAACIGEDDRLFFPERGQDTTAAKAICAACPVAGPCLEEALATPHSDDYGVRAGTSRRERQRMRRQRGIRPVRQWRSGPTESRG